MDKNFILFIKQYAMKKTLIPLYFIITLFIIFDAGISLIRPKLQGQIVDELSVPDKSTFTYFLIRLVLFLIMLLANYIITYLQRYMASLASEEVAADVRQSIHDKLGIVSPSFFKKMKISDILLKTDKDISIIKQCGITSIITLVSNVVTLIIIIPYMFLIHMKIALAVVLLTSSIPFISRIVGKKIKKTSEKVLQGYNDMTNVLNNSYNNWFMVRLFQCYEYVHLRYYDENQKYKKCTNHQNFIYFLNTIITLVVQFIGTVIIWLVGAKEVFENRMTIGTIMILMNYQAIIMNPIINIASFSNEYHTSIVALNDVFTVLSYPNLSNHKLLLQGEVSTIELKNVNFGFDNVEHNILNNINGYFETGKIYGISGKSGQGKSTLFKLLAGILEPKDGSILINGISLCEYNLESYWNRLGYVMQKSMFFEDTIIQNMNLTNKATFEQIQAICEDLDIYDDVNSLEDRWNTILKVEPPNFSEGQMRRIDIARNILKFPQILVFDEAVSNIDGIRREKFYKLLKKISKDRIIIMSTHNQSELEQANVIYELTDKEMVLVK
ncbi:hypothetical protein acsn021_23740 [Anaerocolumna cellulosilytica]|uniref:Uncharacterized protein n=1 Tax=Anaerocolumna cellulosilytica TaxID=433286 RepID=A0A6S6R659_9FIRM|nr:ABC transporter ATP-binding protein [Anaerocolumna cellulosilytica]MBB5193981.1 ABC-type multidrug transport system fused ATPase/permease subunit [Anaerocolumna cellulosilytica]BCJ94805.1 hypothetical protein acsn021_23740 [Anaerocolumna cellulosilytica]